MFDNETWCLRDLKEAFTDGAKVTVTIAKRYNKRSLAQNSLFHAYVGILADEFGYDKDTMKELIRLKWLKETLYDPNDNEMVDTTTGEIMFRLRSTTELNTMEMAELTEEIRIWAMQGWNIVLPLPGEQEELKF
jgi:hypothetical protein